jgi:DNA-binding NarL/FixJ family response regulator
MLPTLNRHLVILLKNHAYLVAYDRMSEAQQTDIIRQMKTLEELTVREQEVLQHILSGKSNREIVATLFISENTVKIMPETFFQNMMSAAVRS